MGSYGTQKDTEWADRKSAELPLWLEILISILMGIIILPFSVVGAIIKLIKKLC